MKPTSVPACRTGRGGSKLAAQQSHGAKKQEMSSSEAEQRLCAEGKTAKSRIGGSGWARGWEEVNVKTLCTGEMLFLRETKEGIQKETRFICSTQVQQCKCSNDASEMLTIHTTPELLFPQLSVASGNKAPVRYG